MKIDLIFRIVLDSKQNWVERTEIFHLSLALPPPTEAEPSPLLTPSPEWHVCYSWRICTDTSLPPKVSNLHEDSLWVFYVLWVWTDAYWHVSATVVSHWVVSLTSKSLVCCLFIPLSLDTTNLFTVSIVLLFLEYHVVGLIRSLFTLASLT